MSLFFRPRGKGTTGSQMASPTAVQGDLGPSHNLCFSMALLAAAADAKGISELPCELASSATFICFQG